MKYELAKELKDVGFPQKMRAICSLDNGGEQDEQNFITYPTLSELIEACGDKFHSLIRGEGGYWLAYTHIQGSRTNFKEGKTPEEAVGRLFIALNKK